MEAQASLHIKVELSMTWAFIACQNTKLAKLETEILRNQEKNASENVVCWSCLLQIIA